MAVHSLEPHTPPLFVWRSSWGLLLAIPVMGCLCIWPFWDGLERLVTWWAASPEDSYGTLIPPISIFLFWQQKNRLERLSFTGSWWGLALITLGGALLLIGQLGTVFTIVQWAFLITLYGLALSLLGWTAFRAVLMPLLILFIMIPLPQFVLANLSTRLQLISSQIGVGFMRLFDVSVFLEGNVIDLGGYKLQVAEACSGLRYLFPLMTIGLLIAYFYKGAPWKRVVLFLSSIPITVLMNSLRVGIIGITVERWGIAMAEGLLHEFQGFVIFMVSTGLLIAEMALLNRIGHESGTWRQLFGMELPERTPDGAVIRTRTLPASFVAAGALLAAFVLITLVIPRPPELIPVRAPFIEFPMLLGAWHGQRDSLEGIYTDELKLDDYLLSNWRDGAGHTVNLYVAYYDSQRKGEAVHSPRSCLPGGGWQMRDFGSRVLATMVDRRPLRVNRSIVQLGDQRELVYYWFQQRGRVLTNEYAVKWFLFWDALTRHRTDGSMVRLIIPLPQAAEEGAADRQLEEMAALIEPPLGRFVPN